jgi:hypothetical protein
MGCVYISSSNYPKNQILIEDAIALSIAQPSLEAALAAYYAPVSVTYALQSSLFSQTFIETTSAPLVRVTCLPKL